MNDPRRLSAALPTLPIPPAPLFADGHETRLAPGLMLHADPAARIGGEWAGGAGRLLTLRANNHTPGAWFACHVALPGAADLTGLTWLILALRSSASHALAIRACLRSGLAGGGFRDDFFPFEVLALPNEVDHLDHLAPGRIPDLAPLAPWRDLVLFLPSAESFALTLHRLEIFGA